jgi:hypothetical protein
MARPPRQAARACGLRTDFPHEVAEMAAVHTNTSKVEVYCSDGFMGGLPRISRNQVQRSILSRRDAITAF